MDAHEQQIRESHDEIALIKHHSQEFEREIRNDIVRLEDSIKEKNDQFGGGMFSGADIQSEEFWPRIEGLLNRGFQENRGWENEIRTLHAKVDALEHISEEAEFSYDKTKLDNPLECNDVDRRELKLLKQRENKLRERIFQLETMRQDMIADHEMSMSSILEENQAMRSKLESRPISASAHEEMAKAWDEDRAMQIRDLEAQVEALGAENEDFREDRRALIETRNQMQTEIRSLESTIAKQTQDITMLNQQLHSGEIRSPSELLSDPYDLDGSQDPADRHSVAPGTFVTFQTPERRSDADMYEETKSHSSPISDNVVSNYDQAQSLQDFKNMSFVEAVKYHMKEKGDGVDVHDELQIEISRLKDELESEREKLDGEREKVGSLRGKLDQMQEKAEVDRLRIEELQSQKEAHEKDFGEVHTTLKDRETQLKDLWQRFEEEKKRWEAEKKPLVENLAKQVAESKRAADLADKVKSLETQLRKKISGNKEREQSKRAEELQEKVNALQMNLQEKEIELRELKEQSETTVNNSVDSSAFVSIDERFDPSFLCITCRSRYIQIRARAAIERNSESVPPNSSAEERESSDSQRYKRVALPGIRHKRSPLIAPSRQEFNDPTRDLESDSIDYPRHPQSHFTNKEGVQSQPEVLRKFKSSPDRRKHESSAKFASSDRFRNYKKSLRAARSTLENSRSGKRSDAVKSRRPFSNWKGRS